MKIILVLFLFNGNIENHIINIEKDKDLSLSACNYLGLSILSHQRKKIYKDYNCEVK